MIAKTNRQAILITGISLILLVILHIIPLPFENRLAQEIENSGHIALFGFFSLILLVFSVQLFGRKIPSHIIHYLIAAGLSILTGAAMEYIQQFVGRDTDIWDFVRDVIGTISFLALYMTVDHSGPTYARRVGYWGRTLIRIASVAAILIMLVPLFSISSLSLYRRAIFPTLCRFEHSWERGLIRTQKADLSLSAPPGTWPEARHQQVGKLVLRPGRYPGITIDEPVADWSRYHNLAFDIFNAVDTPITLVIRIDDVRYRPAPDDRFNRAIKAAPGANSIIIPLADIESGPKQRKMNMAAIHDLILFADRLRTPLTIYIDEIRLY